MTNADDQLKQVDLTKIMGVVSTSPDFPRVMAEMSEQVWSDFIDDDIMPDLTPEQVDEFDALLTTDTTTQADFTAFFHRAVPDYEERFEDAVLSHKEETIRGRVSLLQSLNQENAEKMKVLEQAEQHIKHGEWLQVEQLLSSEFSDQ